MTRQERAGLHKKQERLQIENGPPKSQDLQEGVPVLRATQEGVVEYITHNNILYKRILEKSDVLERSSTIAVNGEIQLGKSLTMQWGFVSGTDIDSATSYTVTYPNKFLNQVFNVVLTDWYDGDTGGLSAGSSVIKTFSGLSGFAVSTRNDSDGFFWQALGY